MAATRVNNEKWFSNINNNNNNNTDEFLTYQFDNRFSPYNLFIFTAIILYNTLSIIRLISKY